MPDGTTESTEEAQDFDIPEEQVEQEQEQETAVAVAAPPSNGHTPSTAPSTPMVQTEERIVYPARPYVAPSAPAAKRIIPKIKPEKNVSARKIIDDISDLPESVDWEFKLYRLPSANRLPSGELVRGGLLESCECMPFDNLQDIIGRLWGGGDYRIVTCAKNDHSPILNYPNVKVVYLSVRSEDYPPKNARGEVAVLPLTSATEPQGEVDDDIAAMRKEAIRRQEENRLRESEFRANKKALELERQELELAKMRKELKGGEEKPDNTIELKLVEMRLAQDKAIEELRRQQEKDREAAERRAKEDRDAADRRFEQMLNKISEIANKPVAAPPVDNTKDLIVAMANNTTTMLGTLIPALTPKKDDSGHQQTMEMIKYGQDQTAKMLDLNARIGAKENSQYATMVNTLISALMKPQQGSGLNSFDTIVKIMEFGRSTFEKGIKHATPVEEPATDGWNPKLGLMGNMGRGLLATIQGALNTMVSNPQSMQFILKLFGKADPTEEEQIKIAQEWERNQQAALMAQQQPQLPAVIPQVQPQQAMVPIVQPQAMQPRPMVQPQQPAPQGQGGMPGVSARPRQPRPAQPQQQRPVQQPPAPQQQAPAQIPAPPAQPVQPQADAEEAAARANAAMQAELASEMSGVSGAEVDISQIGTTPQTQAVPPAQTSPQPPPAVVSQSAPVAVPDDSEERLRERVTEAMALAAENIKDEIGEHEWPEAAAASWNGRFIQALRAMPDDTSRLNLIRSRCHPEVWNTLDHILRSSTAESGQYAKFWEGIRELIAQ